MTRLSAFVALLPLAIAIGAHLTPATATSPTLPCSGTVSVPPGAHTASIVNPDCQGARWVVATLNKGAVFHGQFLEHAAVFPRTATVKVNIHLPSRGNTIVAYWGFN